MDKPIVINQPVQEKPKPEVPKSSIMTWQVSTVPTLGWEKSSLTGLFNKDSDLKNKAAEQLLFKASTAEIQK